MRLVRQASPAELARLDPDRAADPRARGLVEVCWAVLPPRDVPDDERPLGVLYRGLRPRSDTASLSFFDERFFKAGGRPVAGALSEVTGGILWAEILYASQTSLVREGWTVGDRLRDAGTAWDAWTRERPELEETAWNDRPAGQPDAREHPVLPRRLALTLEIVREEDLRFRTRLTAAVDAKSRRLEVADGERVPAVGRMILVGDEWMEVTAKTASAISVKRGRRATRPTAHERGLLVHYGEPLTREVPLALTREDWSF